MLCKSDDGDVPDRDPALRVVEARPDRGGTCRSGAPFFAVSFALGLVTVCSHARAFHDHDEHSLGGLASRVALAGYAFGFYMAKIFPADRRHAALSAVDRGFFAGHVANSLPWLVLAGGIFLRGNSGGVGAGACCSGSVFS